MLIFFLGVLLGVLFGGTLCVAYLRQEVAASINPKLRRVELQLDTIESQLNLAIMTRYAELGARSADSTPRQQQELNNHQRALLAIRSIDTEIPKRDGKAFVPGQPGRIGGSGQTHRIGRPVGTAKLYLGAGGLLLIKEFVERDRPIDDVRLGELTALARPGQIRGHLSNQGHNEKFGFRGRSPHVSPFVYVDIPSACARRPQADSDDMANPYDYAGADRSG
jgi:hypothetical protein